ncbi:MAG: efflux RND transporter periplasmic adaptor subunit [Asticcacaulis sp.]
MMKQKTKLTYLALGLIALVVAGFGIKAVFFSKPKEPPVITAEVTRGDVERTVLSTGALEPYTLVSVGAQTSGRVTSLKVDLGDEVKKGDLIAEIDSATQKNAQQTALAQIASARAQRAQAEATQEQAKREYERQKRLFAADAASKADYESAETAYKTSVASVRAIDAQIAQAEVSLSTAEVNLGYTRITAPIDGTVLAVVTKEGQTINANQTTPTIIKLGQLGRMTIKAEISEADVIRIKPGMEVYFTILGDSKRKYRATLRSIAPAPVSIETTDSITASTASSAIYYNGIFDVDNADGVLRTFMTAQVHIVLEQARDVMTIPATALGQAAEDGSYTVRVQDKSGTLSNRRITVGVNDGTSVEVKSGLKLGEKVVTVDAATAGPGDTGQMRPPRMGGL